MLLIKFFVPFRGESREERMLARRKRNSRDIFVCDFFSVKRDFSVIFQKSQNGFHHGGLARSVFAEEADNLTARKREVYTFERNFAASVFFI